MNLLLRRIPGESNLVYKKIERHLIRLKNKEYPKLPKSIGAFAEQMKTPHMIEQFGNTQDNRRKLYFDSVFTKDYSFQLFASHAVLDTIRNHIPSGQRFYSMDGTFNVIPKLVKQLLIISIEYKNKVCFEWKNSRHIDSWSKFEF